MEASPDTIRKKATKLLGVDLNALRASEIHEQHIQDLKFGSVFKLLITTQLGSEISGLLLKPNDATRSDNNPGPAVLYCHAHGNRYDIGSQELLDSRPALYKAYADDLLELGITVLCLDMPCFGARQDTSEDAMSKAMLWHGKTLFGTMLQELQFGFQLLSGMAEVDPKRIATLGISMGGTHAWWLAALNPKIKACVHMCCFADLACLTKSGAHNGHGHYMTVPGLLSVCSTGQLAGLVAPRPQLICVGLEDWSTPKSCFDIAKTDVMDAYCDQENKLIFHIEAELGHEENSDMRKSVLGFLNTYICQG